MTKRIVSLLMAFAVVGTMMSCGEQKTTDSNYVPMPVPGGGISENSGSDDLTGDSTETEETAENTETTETTETEDIETDTKDDEETVQPEDTDTSDVDPDEKAPTEEAPEEEEPKDDTSEDDKSNDDESKDDETKDDETKDDETKDDETKDDESKDDESKDDETKDDESKDNESNAVSSNDDTADNTTVSANVPQVTDLSGDWRLILVNPWYKLPDEGFSVTRKSLDSNHSVDERIYDDLQEMLADMREEGLSPYVCSSYRTYEYQKNLYARQVNKYLAQNYTQADAEIEAAKWVAPPQTSEHNTGLAVDIVASYYVVLDETQEEKPEQQWLINNSWKYGFILRYPNGKTDITGIYYEPWHYRYVGKEAAKEIYDKGITLEEYLGKA